jgi:hypothetical protein
LQGLLMWTLAAYNGFYHLMADFGLYWLLAMISRTLNVKTTASIPPFMQLRVQGLAKAQLYHSSLYTSVLSLCC